MDFVLRKESKADRDKLYSVSIDIENFPNVMPKYFKSITILKSIENEILVDEKIYFLKNFLKIQTKHVIIHPEIHEVHIVSGPLNGSSFVEHYNKTSSGTIITIKVHIKFNGLSKIFSPLKFLLKKQMSRVMDEFIESAEKYLLDVNKQKN